MLIVAYPNLCIKIDFGRRKIQRMSLRTLIPTMWFKTNKRFKTCSTRSISADFRLDLFLRQRKQEPPPQLLIIRLFGSAHLPRRLVIRLSVKTHILTLLRMTRTPASIPDDVACYPDDRVPVENEANSFFSIISS